MNWTALSHAYAYFIAVVAPILLATLIPSLIVALTPYPKASGFLKVLSFLGQLLSVLTHKDQPGTMKLPLTAKMGEKSTSTKGVLTALLCLSLVAPGCAWWKAHPQVAAALDCGATEIVKALPSVLADVASALAGGSPDWAALGKLELANAPGVIVCAVMKFANPPAGSAIDPNVVKNARAYLKAKGYSN